MGYGSMATGNPKPYHGDFVTPEQIIPPEGIKDVNGNDLYWESCVTMNGNWGYHATDNFWKPSPMLIKSCRVRIQGRKPDPERGTGRQRKHSRRFPEDLERGSAPG